MSRDSSQKSQSSNEKDGSSTPQSARSPVSLVESEEIRDFKDDGVRYEEIRDLKDGTTRYEEIRDLKDGTTRYEEIRDLGGNDNGTYPSPEFTPRPMKSNGMITMEYNSGTYSYGSAAIK